MATEIPRDGAIPRAGAVGAVIVAAGRSSRMAGVDKTFAPLLGRPLIAHTLDQFEAFPPVTEIVLALAAATVEEGRALVRRRQYRKVSRVCAGGARRQDSVRAGLTALTTLRPDDWVIVHDGARPGLDAALLARGLAAVTGTEAGAEAGTEAVAAIAGLPVKDTIKVVSPDGAITATPPRETLWAAQTPQIFRYGLLCQAYAQFTGEATDDATLLESLGHPVKMFLGSDANLKVTTPEDLVVMEALLGRR